MSNPLISVVIPVFDGARFLRAALDAVFAQDYPSVELVVVDDGSTDSTVAILASESRARTLRQSNRGVAAARNAGLAVAQGNFIAFLDSDDLWHPQKLSKQMAYLLARPELGFCITKFKNFIEPGVDARHSLPPHMFSTELPGLIPSAVLLKRETVERAGLFDEAMRSGEDLDYFSRIADLGIAYGMVGESLVDRRIHDGNLTLDLEQSVSAILRSVRQSIVRKRANTAGASAQSKGRP